MNNVNSTAPRTYSTGVNLRVLGDPDVLDEIDRIYRIGDMIDLLRKIAESIRRYCDENGWSPRFVDEWSHELHGRKSENVRRKAAINRKLGRHQARVRAVGGNLFDLRDQETDMGEMIDWIQTHVSGEVVVGGGLVAILDQRSAFYFKMRWIGRDYL